jgi:hypothetical protein
MGLSRCILGTLLAGLSACAPRMQDLIADRHYTEALSAVALRGDAAQEEQLIEVLLNDLRPQVHLTLGKLALPSGSGSALSVLRVRVAGNRLPLQDSTLRVESLSPELIPVELKTLAARVGERMPECYDSRASEFEKVVGGVFTILTFGLFRSLGSDRRICPSREEWQSAMPVALAIKAQLRYGCEPAASGKNLQCTFDFLLPPAPKADSQSPGYGALSLAFLFRFSVRLSATSRNRVPGTFTLARDYELTLPGGPPLSLALAERSGDSFRPLGEVAQRRSGGPLAPTAPSLELWRDMLPTRR